MMWRRVAVVVIALGAAGAAVWKGAGAVRALSAPAGASEIPTARVRRGSVAVTVTARGSLQGGNPEMLSAPMVGSDSLTITELRQPGELVNAGDVVVAFDTTQQEYNLREAQADLAEAEQHVIQVTAENEASTEENRHSLSAAKAQVELATLDMRANPVLSAMEVKQNNIALEAARNRLQQAERDQSSKRSTAGASLAIQTASLNKFKAMAALAQRNIDSMTLRAARAGYVNLQVNTTGLVVATTGMVLPTMRLGDTIYSGVGIAQLLDMKDWVVRAQIPETDRGHLAPGQAVAVSVVALAGRTLAGHVIGAGAETGDSSDRKFEYSIALDQTVDGLRPGMTTNLVITAGKLDNVLWVPSQALFEQDGRPFVYRKTPAGFTPADVTLVNRSESQVALTGVSEGELLALASPTGQSKAAAQQPGALKAIAK
jgi:HlyD family secretion protein